MGIWHSSVYPEPSICTFVSTKTKNVLNTHFIYYVTTAQMVAFRGIKRFRMPTYPLVREMQHRVAVFWHCFCL